MTARLLFLLTFLPFTIQAQTDLRSAMEFNGEAHIALAKSDVEDYSIFKGAFYVDEHFHHSDSLHGIVTPPQLNAFLELELPYVILPHPNRDLAPRMIGVEEYNQMKSTDCANFLSAYPTYGLYEQLMFDFAADFPEICRLDTIGTLPSGRMLLALIISDNPETVEAEPRFLYTSSMHGDETAGYILMLRMIRDILCNYPEDPAIAELVDNTEIWINPLANPDGTYAWGDNNLGGARRTNANFVDLNRNYLDPDDGANPDGNPYQPETIAFMDLAEEVHFNMSSNLHGGVEVANYPWDTWSFEHADDDWWVHVCRQYADTAQANSPSGYFNFLNNGITNGYDWYTVAGGRQDFMTYFHRGRELTLELSDQKFIPSSQFDNFWNYNRSALFNYMEQCLFGLRGIVTDTSTDLPIAANVSIFNHDMENSDVFSQLPFGNYHRYLFEGAYDVTFSAEGYISQTITVNIANDATTMLDVALEPENPCLVEGGTISTASPVSGLCAGDNSPDLITVDLDQASGFGSVFGIVDENNNVVGSSQTGVFNVNGLQTGVYRIKHMSYAQGVNPNVSNASELEGCYDLSNSIFFSIERVEGGQISTSDPTTICGDDGLPSVLSFNLTGAEGDNGRWVVLNNDLSEVIVSAINPNFNFDSFVPGVYKVLHVSYANGVNLSEVDPQNPEGCLNVSNKITIIVEDCQSSLTATNPMTDQGKIEFEALETGSYSLELVDLNGRTLDRIYFNEHQSGERVNLTYSPTDNLKGVYILRLTYGSISEMKKLIIY